MIEAVNDDLNRDQAFMKDFWKLIKKYYEPDGSNDFWYDVMTKARELDKKYQTRLGEHLMNAFMDFLEEKQSGEFRPHQKLQNGGGANANQGR